MIQTCPPTDSLAAYAGGTLDEDRAATVGEHLDACETCSAQYESILSRTDHLVAGLRAAVPTPADPRAMQLAGRLGNIPSEEAVKKTPPSDPVDVDTSAIAEETIEFDPLYVWLGIPPEEQPADHYRLLGIKRFETNLEVIESAADRQMAHLRTFQSGKRGDFAQQVLNQVSAARVCLLNPDKKTAYDSQLRTSTPVEHAPPSKLDLPTEPPQTIDEYCRIVAGLGLIPAKKLDSYLAKLPPDKRPKDAETLARQLVADGHLSKHQAATVYQGKWHNLVLGEYTLLARIGGGGMGDVYKALHRRMGVIRAIKVIKRELVDSPDAISRFHREVLAAAQLSHPHIVLAHDAGEDQGRHFLVMEYVDGPDLGKLVKDRGALPVQVAVDFIIQGARGLAHAHSKGTIHRDVKPGNFLLGSDGVVKVSDLGLARLDPDKSAVDNDSYLTTSDGKILGTVDFMAPEQADDTHGADHRADIYSLGCTLYRLLTGESPYGKGSTIQRMMAHQTAPIPKIRDKFPEVPERIDTAFASMVAKRPLDRPQSMDEVIELLTASIETADAPAAKPPVAKVSSGKPAPPKPTIRADAPSTRRLSGTQKLKQQAQTLLRSKHGVPIIAGGIVLLLALVAVTLAVIMLTLRTPHGEFIVEIDGQVAPDVQVVAKGNGDAEIASAASGWTLTLTEGEYQLDLQGGNDQFQLDKQTAVVTRNGKEVVRLTRKVAAAPTRPDFPANSALSFDGESSYVETPLVLDTSGEFTIEAWVRARDPNRHQLIVNNLDGSAGGVSLEIFGKPATWKLAVARGYGPDNGFDHLNAGRPEAIWHHLAGVKQGDEFRLYLDGHLVQRQTISPARSSRRPLSLGASLYAPGADGLKWNYFFDGDLGEVRISRVARYRTDFRPQQKHQPDGDTLALYHFDEGAGDKLIDSSGHNHHGKIHGAKWVRFGESLQPLPTSQEFALRFSKPGDVVLVRPASPVETKKFTVEAWVTPRGSGRYSDDTYIGTGHVYRINSTIDNEIPVSLESWQRTKGNHFWSFVCAPEKVISKSQHDFGSLVHLAGVFDSGTVTLFVDGQLQGKQTIQATSLQPLPCAFGGDQFERGTFDGDIQAIRLSTSARYSANFTPTRTWTPDSDTLALYLFEAGAGDTLRDWSGNNHHGRIHGAQWVRLDGAPIYTPTNADQIAQVRRLARHGAPVFDVAYYAGGRRAISVSDDCSAKFWDVETGELLLTSKETGCHMRGIAVSPDERFAVTTGRRVVLWDLSGPNQIKTLKDDSDNVTNGASFSPDGTLIAASSRDNRLRVWETATGRLLYELDGTGAAFSPDGNQLVTRRNSSLALLEPHTGKSIRTLESDEPPGNPLFSIDGRRVAASSPSGKVKLWEVSGELLHSFEHDKGASPKDFLAGGTRLLTKAWPPTNALILWDIQSGRELVRLAGHDGLIDDHVVLPGERYVVTGSTDGTLRLWELATGKELSRVERPERVTNCLALSPDGRHLLSAGGWYFDGTFRRTGDNAVYLWRLPERVWPENAGRLDSPAADPDQIVEVRKLKGHGASVQEHTPLPDGVHVVSTSTDNSCIVWDVKTGEVIRRFRVGGNPDMGLSLDGKLVATTSGDQTLSLWDVATGERLWKVDTGCNDGNIEFSPNSDLLLTYRWNRQKDLRVYRVEDGKEVWRKSYEVGWFAGSGKFVLALADNRRDILVLNAANGELLGTLTGHNSDIHYRSALEYAVLVDDERGHCYSGAVDGTVIQWDVTQQKELQRFRGGSAQWIRPDALLKGGSVLLTRDGEHALRLWDVQSGQMMSRATGHSDLIMSAKALPTDRHFITGSMDKTMRLWEYLPDLKSVREIAHVDAYGLFTREVSILSDGKYVISCGRWGGKSEPEMDHDLHVWRLPERVWPENNRTAQEIVGDGAILRLTFEEDTLYNRGDVAYFRDLSGRGNDARCLEEAGSLKNGLAGAGIDCTKGRLRLPAPLLAGLSDYTIAGWVKVSPQTFAEAQFRPRFYSEHGADTRQTYSVVELNANRRVRLNSYHKNWQQALLGSLPAEGWVFLGVTLQDGAAGQGTLRLMIDDTTHTGTLQSVQQHYGFTEMGVRGIDALDEIIIFNRALSESELAVLREHGRQGKPLNTSSPSSK